MPALLALLQQAGPAAPTAHVIVHLEDNERRLLSHTAVFPFETLARTSDRQLHHWLKKDMAHPVRHQLLLAAADLITGITTSLEKFAPPGVPFALLHPELDLQTFRPFPADPLLRSELGLTARYRVNVYPGGANLTNAEEPRTLYAAIALLNQRGTPVKLIRFGPPAAWFTRSLSPAENACVIDLGFVLRESIPEFLASGRPVILPRSNIAALMIDGTHALFPTGGSPADISSRCEEIFRQPTLATFLGQQGRRFAEQQFDLTTNSRIHARLYQETLSRPPVTDWFRPSAPFNDEADLFPLLSSRSTTSDLLAFDAQRRHCGGLLR